MADGAGYPQQAFHFPHLKPVSRLRLGEIVVDLFAGGGGASHALETALARAIDIAINHNPWAIGMHAANHPYTRHLCEDVWEADPWSETLGRLVGWLHASPDCTHHSQARGGQPRDKATRALSWVVLKWAGKLKRRGTPPRIISLENVEQILKWGPLIAKRDKATGRIIKLVEHQIHLPRGRIKTKLIEVVAEPGERVPVQQQYLIPDKRHAGRTWRQFVAALRGLGYDVDWRKLKACDYGAGTSRMRLYMIARCDGEPIRWPAPTHGPGRGQPYVTAADCIDWALPCPSIFERRKPLADATHRRIARGIKRYVLEAAEPFIVQCANASANGIAAASQPLGVVTAWPKGGSHALGAPTLVQVGYGEREGQAPRALDLNQPLGVVVAGGIKHAVAVDELQPMAMAFLDQANAGFYDGCGNDVATPLSAVTLRGTNTGAGADEPVRVMTAGGEHHAVVECTLSQEHEDGALRVAAFLMRYYGRGGQGNDLRDPMATVTVKERLALVTVTIRGTPYVIVDIGLRMLQRQELFRAQGFPLGYIIDRTADGRRLTNSRSVAMCGNSVSPPPLHAIAIANLDPADDLQLDRAA